MQAFFIWELGLRWGDVDLLNRWLEVRQAWVRNAMPTPKSTASRRAIAFGLKTAGALEEQFQATAYKADDAPRLLAPGARDTDRSVRADPLLFEASAESGSDR